MGKKRVIWKTLRVLIVLRVGGERSRFDGERVELGRERVERGKGWKG